MKVLQLMALDNTEIRKYKSTDNFANPIFMGYDILRDKVDIQWYRPQFENWFTRKLDKILGANVSSFVLGQFTCIRKCNESDVIYFPLDAHVFLLGVFRWLRLIKKPIFMVCHSSYNMNYIPSLKKRIFKRFERFIIFRTLDQISFASPYLLANAKKDFKVPVRHQSYVLWGGKFGFNNAENEHIDRSKCGYYISIGQAKRDYPTLIKAFAQIPDAKLKIITWSSAILEGTGLTALPENIEMIDNPDDDKRWLRMRELYRNAKAALIPISLSSDVPSGATFLVQAMASGLPLVVTDMGNNFIDVEKEDVGIKVGYRDVDGWIQAIQKLEKDSLLINTLSDNCTQLAKTWYNYENFSDQVLTELKKLVRQ